MERQSPDSSPDGSVAAPLLVPGDIKRALLRFIEDSMTHHAAALTYYSLLSLFPALLFGVAVLGLVGEGRLIDEAAGYMREVGAPAQTITAVTTALDTAVSQRGSAIGALTLGLIASIWGASAAFGAAGTALNVVLRIRENRNIVRRKLSDLLHTIVVLLLVTATFLLIFLGGDAASAVFGLLGLGETATDVWRYARWPTALVSTLLVYAITYYAAPDVAERRFRWISPGALAGVSLWLLLSWAFFLYVATFPRYSIIYGAFAAIVILLVWIWLTNLALLLGAELNAVIDIRHASHEVQTSVTAAPPVEDDEPSRAPETSGVPI
jgi:membrane protein